MSEIASVRQATAKLAGLYANGQTPDPAELERARSRLQVAKLDRDIRKSRTASVSPGAAEVAHLVGLLVGWGGTDEFALDRLARSIREAADSTPGLTDPDRVELAKMLLPGGEK